MLRDDVALVIIDPVIPYFAYGSNTNIEHLRAFLSTYSVDGCEVSRPRMAILHGYRMRTNYYSTLHGAGACSIERRQGSNVEGVAMEISDGAHVCLRVKEGYPRCYEELRVEISTPPALRLTTALTYIVIPQLRQLANLPVTNSYRDLILDAAKTHHFSQKYQRYLRRVLRCIAHSEDSSNPQVAVAASAS